jgi:hypothetical protein
MMLEPLDLELSYGWLMVGTCTCKGSDNESSRKNDNASMHESSLNGFIEIPLKD